MKNNGFTELNFKIKYQQINSNYGIKQGLSFESKDENIQNKSKFKKFMIAASAFMLCIAGINLQTFEAAEDTQHINSSVSAQSALGVKNSVSSYIASSYDKNELIDIVRDTYPTVVDIYVREQSTDQHSGLEVTSLFCGSGVIFKADEEKAYIITNEHVVSEEGEIYVRFEDYELVQAELVAAEPEEDIAVISIDNEDLHSKGITQISIAEFGDSNKVQLGENVLVIGNALGEGKSVTFGIISVKNKEIEVLGTGAQLTVIQTDAAINSGNSGGALFNMYGEVIGINCAGNDNAQLMGYSIPSNIAVQVAEDLLS